MKLTFLGGAKEVSGANYLLESEDTKILIDCGSSQGSRAKERENYNDFKFNPKEIDALFVTHSHIDHIGRIPKLVKDGFEKNIFSTAPAKDAAYELLLDAYQLMTKDLRPNEKPLFEIGDIDKTMSLWRTVAYHQKIKEKDFDVEFYNSGHILGSASIKISDGKNTIVFSGDLGNIPAPLVKDTEYIEKADYAVIESAYGGKTHESVAERKTLLEDLIEGTVKKNGVLLIPAFAMERTQELLYELNDLVENGRIPKIPIFIDSPLAIKMTSIYQKYAHDNNFFDKEAIELAKKEGSIFNFPGLKFTLTKEQSKEINDVPPPKIIIAGSGMSNGGRIIHHELRYLPQENNTILFVGFQSEGTLGRNIMDGQKEVNILNEKVAVNCRVVSIGAYSAHADQPLLLKWTQTMKDNLKKIFIVQGEEEQSKLLAEKIKDMFAINAIVPTQGDVFDL